MNTDTNTDSYPLSLILPKILLKQARAVDTVFLPNAFSERVGKQTLKQVQLLSLPPFFPVNTGNDLNCFQEKKNYCALTTRHVSHKEEEH